MCPVVIKNFHNAAASGSSRSQKLNCNNNIILVSDSTNNLPLSFSVCFSSTKVRINWHLGWKNIKNPKDEIPYAEDPHQIHELTIKINN